MNDPTSSIVTSAAQVVELFGESTRARAEFQKWKSTRPQVADFVFRHDTIIPYLTTSEDVRNAAATTVHALGDVKKSQVVDIDEITNWNPQFALTHVLHYTLERVGRPFTYQELRCFCEHEPAARNMLWDPAWKRIYEVEVDYGRQLAHDAMQWRVGNAYYSFMRELYTVAYLREQGVPLLVHPLADALFRVDAWVDRTVLALYVGNPRFRSANAGRKPRPEELLGSSFRYAHVDLPTQHSFGNIHMPSIESLNTAERELRQLML